MHWNVGVLILLAALAAGRAEAQAIEGRVDVRAMDRGSFRLVRLQHVVLPESTGSAIYAVESSVEMHVQTIYFSPQPTDSANIQLRDERGLFHLAWATQFEATGVARFEPPLPLQEGDHVRFQSGTVNTSYSIYLEGLVPGPNGFGLR